MEHRHDEGVEGTAHPGIRVYAQPESIDDYEMTVTSHYHPPALRWALQRVVYPTWTALQQG